MSRQYRTIFHWVRKIRWHIFPRLRHLIGGTIQPITDPPRLVYNKVEYILEKEIFILGRGSECHLQIKDLTVSRLHAIIERKGSYLFLHDANTLNGTFVNNTYIRKPYRLKNGDQIQLGEAPVIIAFLFHDSDPTLEGLFWLRYDEQQESFFLKKQRLDLSPLQHKLLYHLFYPNADEICSYRSCAQEVWGEHFEYQYDYKSSLHRMIAEIRRELEKIDPAAGNMIENCRGSGYKLHPELKDKRN